jgi:succinate-semialdehyde dehydrogenase
MIANFRTRAKAPRLLPAIRQIGMMAHLKDMALFKSQALIGGKWIDATDGRTLPVNNPATGELLTTVPFMGGSETQKAIAAASQAFPPWSKRTAHDRSKIMRKWFDLLVENKDDLAKLMVLEQGKPLAEATGEILYGAGFVEFYAEEGKRIFGDIIPSPFPEKRMFVMKQPIGVVGAITPWNFPLAMITRKVAPALAAGCTVIIKPAELTPLTALAAAELALQAGVPPGVINVVMGDAVAIGNALMDSTEVRKITFTGSTGVGKILMTGAAKTVKKVSLELGGNAPCIIFDDANLEVAVKGALAGKYRNTGQTCVCVNRILVQDGIYDKFAEAFTKAVSELHVGNGLEKGVTQGPLINEAAVEKVENHVKDAVSQGAKLLLGGKRHSLGRTFYEPTVLGDATEKMLIFREEVFGPVAPLIRFKTDEEAIKMANDTEFGLAAYAFTENIARGWRIAESLEYGMVGLNEGLISTEVAPFGGMKQSGLGREGSHYGIDEYLELKYVCLGNMKQPVIT